MYQNQSYIFSYHISHRIRRDTIVCAKLNIKSYIDFKARCRWLCLWKNFNVNAFSSRSTYLFPQWKEVDGLYSRLGVLWKSNLLISSAKIVDLLVYNECKTEQSRLKVLSYITRYMYRRICRISQFSQEIFLKLRLDKYKNNSHIIGWFFSQSPNHGSRF